MGMNGQCTQFHTRFRTSSQLYTMAESVRSATVMRTRWRLSPAVVRIRSTVPARLNIWSTSTHCFHARVTVVAVCHMQAEILSWHQEFWSVWTHSCTDIAPFHVDEVYLHYLPHFHFVYKLSTDLASNNADLTGDTKDVTSWPMCTPSLET